MLSKSLNKPAKKPRPFQIISKRATQKRKIPIEVTLNCLEFASSDLSTYLNFLRVSKTVQSKLQEKTPLVLTILPFSLKNQIRPKIEILLQKDTNPAKLTEQIFSLVKSQISIKIKSALDALDKIFGYNTTKDNICNQVIDFFGIDARFFVNGKNEQSVFKQLKKDNYSSFFFSIFDIQKAKFYDDAELKIRVFSNKMNLWFEEKISVSEKEVISNSLSLKVYAYNIKNHFLLVSFKGDAKVLFVYYQISLAEVLYRFEKILKNKLALFCEKKQKTNEFGFKLDVNKFLAEKTDFELIFSLYSTKKRALYYINTRLLPKLLAKDKFILDNQTKQVLSQFALKNENVVFFAEGNLMEKFDFSDLCLEFDNGLGMAERLSLTVMSQIYLKDNEQVNICESGFSRLEEEKGGVEFERQSSEFEFYQLVQKREKYFYRFGFFKRKTSNEIFLDNLFIGLII